MTDKELIVCHDDNGDEPLSNHSNNPHFADIAKERMSRRDMLSAGLSTAVVGLFGGAMRPSEAEATSWWGKGPLPPQAGPWPPAKGRPRLDPKLGFEAISPVRSDTTTIARGYKVQALVPWGEPLIGDYPPFKSETTNTGAEQEQQVGSHHDGMHYFPFQSNPNSHGLLCINHEYVDQRVLHAAGPTSVNGQRPTDEVRKEIAAHGVSVIEIKRTAKGEWNVVRGDYNHRVTAGTPMEICGPVRGSDLVKTRYSHNGTMTRGTLNNCANGYTPWGTYLTCEENWAGYFVNRVQQARADALLNWFEQTQPQLYPGPKASFAQDRYYARYYPETNQILGIFDEIFDQKVTNVVYTQAGSVFSEAGRVELGLYGDLLNQAGIPQDLSTQLPRELSRFGVPTANSRYRWETAESGEDEYIRFDASIKGTTALDDYRNEPNCQGWVVEIDPKNPNSVPKKRTTLGRFAHEGCVFAPAQPGRPLVFYMGDDATNEYIYKFVTKDRYTPNRHGDILDQGTLYVARFNADGTGDWLALDINDPSFVMAAIAAGVEFKDQADVLVNTRLAADVVGATKMDRPEWGTVHPETREVYMALTNHNGRSPATVDPANPRGPNPFGHIIRWNEKGGDSDATRFEWDIFVLAGPQGEGRVLPAENGPPLTEDNIFASPDGLWIDSNGILWIQTDMSGSQQAGGPFGENSMFAANPITGEIRRFLSGPPNQETTGVTMTPDRKTMFVNFQHPGDRSTPGNFTSNWPDSGAVYRHPGDPIVTPNPQGPRPRSATIVITREDGGEIGL